MKKIFTLFLAIALTISIFPMDTKAAPAWPDDTGIQADGGIVMDANNGTVLYGQNIHVQYFPASITKILTALLVLENADMNDIVTFSHNAVYNVESGSSNAGLDEGDQLTVKDCLYAMMLRSANESASALAEHVAGSVEAFCDMMNAKAKELGCRNTNFENANGLNNPEQVTTPYDMALIASAAFKNDAFVEIVSTTSYKLPPTKRNTEGLVISPGHKMLHKNNERYYPGIIGGKTGYTTLAGNTLVTCAEKDGLKLVTVILNGHQTHYEDTKTLLDFGFNNFKNLKIADNENRYGTFEDEIEGAGVPLANQPELAWDNSGSITLPKDAEFSDAAAAVSYEISMQDSQDTVAKIQYTYGDRKIGAASLKPGALGPKVSAASAGVSAGGLEDKESSSANDGSGSKSQAPENKDSAQTKMVFSTIGMIVLIGLVLAVVAGGGIAFKIHRDKKEEEERLLRHKRRVERLKESGFSESEFEEMLAKRQSGRNKSSGDD